jgi:RNA polymerase sigma-70 factor (ECF subfamily)
LPAASHQDSDQELIRRAKAGEFAAFDDLVARHEGRVYSVVMGILRQRQDAEDAVQTAFMNAFEHLGGFREDAGFGTWITRIAVNSALKALRKRKNSAAVSMSRSESSDDGGRVPHPQYIAHWRDDPLRILEQKNLRQVLDAAIGTLPEKQRVVFVLRDVQGMSVKETSEVTGLTEANVKVRLLRARLALRERLTRAFGDERPLAASHDHEGGRFTPARTLLRSYEAR